MTDNYMNSPAIVELADDIRNKCLIEQGSILTDTSIWTPQNFDTLYSAYNENPDESSNSFAQKLRKQLAPVSSPARQLFAELYILEQLLPGNVSGDHKINIINEVLSACEPQLQLTEEIVSVFHGGGVVNGGIGYNVRRFAHFMFLIEFGRQISKLPIEERRARLSTDDSIEESIYTLATNDEPAFQRTLCFLFAPNTHLEVISQDHLRDITKHWSNLIPEKDQSLRLQRKASIILSTIREKEGNDDFNFYINREEWSRKKKKSSKAPTADPSPSGEPEIEKFHSIYTAIPENLAEDLLVDEEWIRRVTTALDERKQIVLQGPPGTGKTYLARSLARALSELPMFPDSPGNVNADTLDNDQPTKSNRVTLVQFHPAYTYEDFFEGFRPKLVDGKAELALRRGPLRNAAAAAAREPNHLHFLVIDEMNRGNLSQLFGELYFLLEYRDESVELMYSQEEFALPENLRIIGTMNTADRSIALVDSAMRRRFAFFSLRPDTNPVQNLLSKWCEEHGVDQRIDRVWQSLNVKIGDPERMVGPSYFMRQDLDYEETDSLERLWESDIIPLLEETFYSAFANDPSRFDLDSIRRRVDSEISEGS